MCTWIYRVCGIIVLIVLPQQDRNIIILKGGLILGYIYIYIRLKRDSWT